VLPIQELYVPTRARTSIFFSRHPKVVQDLLGHSTITLTLDTYSHLTQPLHEQAARTMDALLSMQGEPWFRAAVISEADAL